MPAKKWKPLNPRHFAGRVNRLIERRAGKGYQHPMGSEKKWMHRKVQPTLKAEILRHFCSGFGLNPQKIAGFLMEIDSAGLVKAIARKHRLSPENAKKMAIEMLEEIYRRYGKTGAVIQKIQVDLQIPEKRKENPIDALATIATHAGLAKTVLDELKS